MRLIYVIFDKKVFRTTDPARTWMSLSAIEPIARVQSSKSRYKYTIAKRRKKGKMKAINIAKGVTYIYE